MNPNNPTHSAQPAHTPLPWHVGMKPGPMIYGPQGEQIADLTGALSFNAGPNAAFILRACNSHAQLVAAIQQFLDESEDGGDMNDIDWNRLRAALSAAKE